MSELLYSGKPVDSLYLHFLNREIYRSSGQIINDVNVLQALKVISISTDKLLSTSVAFVWESFYDLPHSSKFILSLLAQGMITLIGSYYSMDYFLANNQQLYRHDKKRYSMYFKKIPKELIKHLPTIIKLNETTAFLEEELLTWSDTGKSSIIHNTKENKNLLKSHKVINKTLEQRENKAITATLFSNGLSIENKNQLSRNISLLHLNSYLKYINADIFTGYPGLEYFNTASKSFPIYDLDVRNFLLNLIGIDLNKNFNKLFNRINETEHHLFVKKLEKIVEGIYYVALTKTNLTIPRIMTHWMKDILKSSLSRVNISHGSSWGSYYQTLCDIDNFFFNHEPSYNEFDLTRKRVDVVKKILLCTATNKETQKTLEIAENFGLRYQIRYIGDHSIYHLGTLSGVDINVVQSEMGTESPGGATLAVSDVCGGLNPSYVISVGICYGLAEEKSNLGDVVVASQLELYDLKKVSGDEEEIIPRGDKPSPSVIMIDRLRSSAITYNKSVSIHFERFITGNTLVSSAPAVKKLKKTFKEAFAGDMEAGGIYSVCEKRKINWGIVKGISDWGYNKNDTHQDIARINAIEFVFYSIAQGGF